MKKAKKLRGRIGFRPPKCNVPYLDGQILYLYRQGIREIYKSRRRIIGGRICGHTAKVPLLAEISLEEREWWGLTYFDGLEYKFHNSTAFKPDWIALKDYIEAMGIVLNPQSEIERATLHHSRLAEQLQPLRKKKWNPDLPEEENRINIDVAILAEKATSHNDIAKQFIESGNPMAALYHAFQSGVYWQQLQMERNRRKWARMNIKAGAPWIEKLNLAISDYRKEIGKDPSPAPMITWLYQRGDLAYALRDDGTQDTNAFSVFGSNKTRAAFSQALNRAKRANPLHQK